MKFKLKISNARPYFAEFPYYLWGEVNYKSDGNCRRPTDRDWTKLDLMNRVTTEQVSVKKKKFSSTLSVESDSAELAARASLLLMERSGAIVTGENPKKHAGAWSHAEAFARTRRVQDEFSQPKLSPFDSHLFWGSWKWVGWYATDFTWVGRWIMNSVLTHDARAVKLGIEWLREGTFHKDQSSAIRYALSYLTGKSFPNDNGWVNWYDKEGQQQYPEPDFDRWLADLKRA